MSISSGTKVGPYEILSQLGAGGMGEVYRARDTRLNRDVAIKVLPASFAADEDRLRRFEQEAQATSALNHPNILTVHDFGTHEGAPYIVAELLEGEELRESLSHGAIPPRKAIAYATQIASGLAAAHDKGIVHRDLKPENVFITADGRVKILDFGLAKLRARASEAGSDSNVQTQKVMTDPGVVMGTVGYMSPEQVRGQNIDHRTDIFSFGLILYEMLAGRRAFTSDSAIEVMNAILKEQPPELSETNSKINPALEQIVRRCIEKKPEMRFHSAHDLGFALSTLTAPSDSRLETAASLPAVTEAARRPTLFGNARLAWIAAFVLLLVALSMAAVAYLRPAPAVARAYKLSALPPEKATLMSGQAPVISPDGSRIAFVAIDETGRSLIFLRPLDSLTAQPLAGTDGAFYPFWSPDSRSLGFFANGKLKRIEAGGGQPMTLADAPVARGGSWNRDGVIIYTPTPPSPTLRISASGGEPTAIMSVDFARGQKPRLFPQFLPDGRHYLYFSPAGQKPGTPIVGVASLDSEENKQLLNAGSAAVYAPPGYLLFRRETTLVAQHFDVTKLELSGEPFPVAEQVGFDGLSFQTLASASDNAVLAYQSMGTGNSQLVWFDREGKQLGMVGSPGDYSGLALSPDNKRLAFQRVDDTGNVDVWLMEFGANSFSRFTFEPVVEFSPVWSPDGSRIAFAAVEGPPNIFQKLSSGAGEVVPLFKSLLAKLPRDWSSDGHYIICETVGLTTRWDLWVLSLSGESKFEMFLQTPNNEQRPCFAPSGRWVAYESDESGKKEVYVRSFPASGAKWQVSSGGGTQPRFTRDGKELLYVSADRKIMAAPVKTDGASFESGAPKALFETHIFIKEDRPGNQYAVTSDGQRFLINSTISSTGGSPISVLVNWTAEAKK
ncbi:MAG TPA: protein kinase [Blastocatellia bacterium]|nr:protein kinase [Blastocatellia bacterium]